MTAGIYNIKNIEQGSRWTFTLAVTDSTSSVLDLTGFTGKMSFKGYKDEEPIVTFSTVDSTMTITGSTGIISVTAEGSVTSSWDFDKAVYDLIIDNSGASQRILQGDVNLSRQVTTI